MKIGGVSNLTSFLPKKIRLIFDFDVSLKFAEELLNLNLNTDLKLNITASKDNPVNMQNQV
jgi:hypothetical protein